MSLARDFARIGGCFAASSPAGGLRWNRPDLPGRRAAAGRAKGLEVDDGAPKAVMPAEIRAR
jgi:hypothetical protein